MTDDNTTTTAGDASSVSDPVDVETQPSGDQGDGATVGDHGKGRADESSASDSTDTPSDDDDALTKALANGTTDELDDEGKRKKAPAEASKDDKKPEEKAEKEPESDGLADEDKKELDDLKPRDARERRKFVKVLKDRAEARKAKSFADAVIADAKSAGLETSADLQALIAEERHLRSLASDKDRADYLRKMADSIHPLEKPAEPQKPAELTADLKEAVDAGFLKPEDAEALARMRADKAKPKEEPRASEPPKPTGPAPEAIQKGYADIAGVAKEYQARYAADWPSFAKEVETELGDLIQGTDPKTWPKLSRLVIEKVIRAKQPALKKPAQTTRPASAPPKTSAVMSEEEEREALANGRSL